ncbi:hypothetical protein NQ318_011192 [Aromia moschata]|uniref:Transposase n=1 Tax=Aromia moschata TaxID=1265417 RepID=A0AAV8YK41_9CUCU|nr:hypothetical protein NQ318_011192 [Aromia moschata]
MRLATQRPIQQHCGDGTWKGDSMNFGSIKPGVHTNRPVVDNENIEIAILGYFAEYPTISTRQAALELGISKTSVLKILRKHKFHPYAFSIVQHLKETDFPRRVEFCQFILLRSQENDFFLDNIIWSDEAKFTKNGVFDRRNSHHWSDYNVTFRERNFQQSWQVNAYCAIRNGGVVALEFYQDNLYDSQNGPYGFPGVDFHLQRGLSQRKKKIGGPHLAEKKTCEYFLTP